MKTISFLAALLLAVSIGSAGAQVSPGDGVYRFTMKNNDGEEVSLADYAGHVVLIVNTASKCGYTPQYASLEKLYRRYAENGLRILAFPANNFGAQEPGTDEQIREFCTTNYDVTFHLFSKISVKGDDIHPMYAYLTKDSPFPGEIRWNFTKFLVDQKGEVVARYETKTDPLDESVVTRIEAMLNE
jgi:glutathione peroxidase